MPHAVAGDAEIRGDFIVVDVVDSAPHFDGPFVGAGILDAIENIGRQLETSRRRQTGQDPVVVGCDETLGGTFGIVAPSVVGLNRITVPTPARIEFHEFHDLLVVFDTMAFFGNCRPLFAVALKQELDILCALGGEFEVHLRLAGSVGVTGDQEALIRIKLKLLKAESKRGKARDLILLLLRIRIGGVVGGTVAR